MRVFQVSTEVYAAVWKRHQPGDESEDDILRREFEVPPASCSARREASATVGFYDRRNEVSFPAGFEIHDLQRKHRARADDGLWHLSSDGRAYATLNQLTEALGSGDSAWRYWRYTDDTTGQVKQISDLRRDNKIHRRLSRSGKQSAEELGL